MFHLVESALRSTWCASCQRSADRPAAPEAPPKEILRGFIDLDARVEWDELCIGATLYEAAHPSAPAEEPPIFG